MDELQNLLDSLEALEAASDEELLELETQLQTAAEEAAEQLNTEALESISAGVAAVRAEAETRMNAAIEAQAKVDELMSSIRPEASEQDGDDEGDAEGDGDGEGDGDETPPAEPEVVVEPVVEVVTPEPEAVAAATAPKPKRTMPRPPAKAKATAVRDRRVVALAAGDVPGFSAGREIPVEAIAKAWSEKTESVLDAPGKFKVGFIKAEYTPERTLTGDLHDDMRKMNAVVGPEAMQGITAAGGLCNPLTPDYSLMTISTDDRPLKAALPAFRATRGGVTYVLPPTLAEVTAMGAVARFTEGEDASGANYPKPCPVVDCTPPVEVTVEAQTGCLQIGNWQQLFWPEQFQRFWQLVGVQHARTAENALWTEMVAQSTAVTAGQVLGTFRDVIGVIARGAAAFRSRHRMALTATLRLAAPTWLRDQMLVDLIRQMPGDDTYSRALAIIDGALRSINVSPIWSPDAGGQEFGAEAGGSLDGWPTQVEVILYHEGAFTFLDGGRLDFGTEIRDSVLNETNDVRAFFETFENVAFVGVESLAVTMTVCPNGAAAELDSVACVGS